VNFHADLRRIYDELAAEGFNSLALDLAIECTPTFGQVEQTTQLLRFLASQLDDDPGDYQNARLPESERFVFVNVTSFKVDEKIVSRGKTLKMRYEINSSDSVSDGVWLGGTLLYKGGGDFSSGPQDKPISLSKGTSTYERDFTVPANAPPGTHTLKSNIWHKSMIIAKAGTVETVIVVA
jgi:hypothetical protein